MKLNRKTKLLEGKELAEFIKERHLKSIRNLKQEYKIKPAIAVINDSPENLISRQYLKIKQAYATDIGVDFRIFSPSSEVEAKKLITELNNDDKINGIVYQLPSKFESKVIEKLLNQISVKKDIDGLRTDNYLMSATATAIMWLLAAYNIDLRGKKIVIVGEGRLVGRPLAELMRAENLDPIILNKDFFGDGSSLKDANIIISATGVAGLIKKDMLDLSHKIVLVEAGLSEENGVVVGDFNTNLWGLQDGNLMITAKKGGLGPLTIACLYENLIITCRSLTDGDL
jgi:methylenetetrahydrofolate dehydrogenase (NADP+)/methenyltetrahydrofolate cyclohydrolase